jgi:ribose 5-phosphate isomerase A
VNVDVAQFKQQAAEHAVEFVDESKLSPALGTRWSVPVEVVPFGWRSQAAYLESLGAQPVLRRNSDGLLSRPTRAI